MPLDETLLGVLMEDLPQIRGAGPLSPAERKRNEAIADETTHHENMMQLKFPIS